jgi:multiple sugar transport system permease protein
VTATGIVVREATDSERRAGWAFITPALVLLTVFFFLPVVGALVLSFTDFDIYAVSDLANLRWVGFRNYTRLLETPLFWTALGNTFYFVVAGGILSLVASLGAALLVNARAARWQGFFRTVYFAPVVTTLVAVAVVWRAIYHPRYGLLNAMLAWIGVGPIDWLGDPRWAMPALVFMAVWKNFGYNMIIFVAGLQTIPEELYEAAHLDGAGAWRRFWHITLPMLRPTFVFVSVITMIGYFQLFAEPYVMTQGGPLKSTLSVVLFMYEEGFRWWRMGFAAAIAFVLFLIILVATLVQLKLQRMERA